jgi:hypothetical protein
MQLTRWKLIAGGAALVGVTAGGIAAASDDGFDLNDRSGAIELNDDRGTGANLDLIVGDGSPESVDSPNESVEESADSPFDSPDDAGLVDPSPESADSPNESAEDSPPAAPAPANDSPADSENSADSADSPASTDSGD